MHRRHAYGTGSPEALRQRCSEVVRGRILDEAAQPRASLAKIALRYGIARRILCPWKQELARAPAFVAVQIIVQRHRLVQHWARG